MTTGKRSLFQEMGSRTWIDQDMQIHIVPAPEALKKSVDCFRIVEYTGEKSLSIKVFPNGKPGIVFQLAEGRSMIENIVTRSGLMASVPAAFIHRGVVEPSVMNYKQGPYTTIQVILRPHAIQSIFGIPATELTHGLVDLTELSSRDFNQRLLEAKNDQDRITLLASFLLSRLQQADTRDRLVEESLDLIHKYIHSIQMPYLLETLHISERQFEKRFSQTVGIAPQAYIRMRRFNEAVRLIQTGCYSRLTDVALALNYYDQSHFIHDFKMFTGVTPKILSQDDYDFHYDQVGSFYL